VLRGLAFVQNRIALRFPAHRVRSPEWTPKPLPPQYADVPYGYPGECTSGLVLGRFAVRLFEVHERAARQKPVRRPKRRGKRATDAFSDDSSKEGENYTLSDAEDDQADDDLRRERERHWVALDDDDEYMYGKEAVVAKHKREVTMSNGRKDDVKSQYEALDAAMHPRRKRKGKS